MIYLDNSATSFPKPPCVKEAMIHFIDRVGANPGRAGHRLANEAARVVYNTRELINDFFNGDDSLRVVFTQNITEALNVALLGFLRSGDHVITSSLEHNSMMRPLRFLEKSGVELSIVYGDPKGFIDPDRIKKLIKNNTVLIAVNHGSNVMGTIQPIGLIGKIAREGNVLFLVDSAQTAGAIPLDMQKEYIDILCFTGHKSLLGPMGTGGLILGNRVNCIRMNPLKLGGTGSFSEKEVQPGFLPDFLESGTLNVAGLAGLGASIQWINKKGIAAIRCHEIALTEKLLHFCNTMDEISLYGPKDAEQQMPTVSFTVKGFSPSDLGFILDDERDILCRVGLHCSPAAHKTIRTFPTGTVRFGMGIFNTPDDIDYACSALSEIIQRKKIEIWQ